MQVSAVIEGIRHWQWHVSNAVDWDLVCPIDLQLLVVFFYILFIFFVTIRLSTRCLQWHNAFIFIGSLYRAHGGVISGDWGKMHLVVVIMVKKGMYYIVPQLPQTATLYIPFFTIITTTRCILPQSPLITPPCALYSEPMKMNALCHCRQRVESLIVTKWYKRI
jgi:hypothetical protein